MEQVACEKLFAKSFSFWEHLTQEERAMLCDNTQGVIYQKGQLIHGGEEHCAGVILVKQGQLRTYLMSEDGREVTLYRLFGSDVCVLSASCAMEALNLEVYIDSQELTEALLINAATFRQLAARNIYVESFAYKLATTRLTDFVWALQQILFMGVDKRLGIFLWDEMLQQNTMVIKLTHEQIATYIGSAREVVSRMLKYFEEEGIVHLARGTVEIVSKEKLKNIIQ